MKKYICILFSLISFLGCTGWITDEMNESNKILDEIINDHASRIEELERLCAEINSNIASINSILNVLQTRDYVTAVVPIEEKGEVIGYKISFKKSADIILYHGIDVHNPLVSIRADSDGLYYWTVDGEWILDENGDKIRAGGIDGITPRLRITNDVWEVTYDDGKTWTPLGSAVGEDGHTFFQSVSVSDRSVDIVLTDGTSLSVPFYRKIEISLEMPEEKAGIAAGKDIYVDYKLTGDIEDATVTASSDGNYIVRIEKSSEDSGTIVITCPDVYADGYVNFCVNDPYGYSYIQVIRFYESKMIFSEGLEYSVDSNGGVVNIPFSVNFEYSVKLEDEYDPWLSIEPQTKAEMREESISVKAEMNSSFSMRQARILVFAENNPYTPYTVITVNQASAYFNIDKSNYAVPAEGGKLQANIESSLGLKVRKGDDASWIETNIVKGGGNRYTLDMSVSPNYGAKERNCILYLYSDDEATIMGEIRVIQLCENVEDPDDMVFVVRANYVNEFTAYLPLAGEVDCYVDWGDGTVEYYKNNYDWSARIFHEYDIDEPQSYTVRVSGRVTSLNSSDLKSHAVTEVKQWGNTGLNDMGGAFSNNTMLKKIAPDTRGAFSEVYSFNSAFSSCLFLEEIPENLLKYAHNAVYVSDMFYRTGIKRIPKSLFHACGELKYASRAFYMCESLLSVPEELFMYCPKLEEVSSLFSECKSITTLPGKLFSYSPEIISVNRLCSNCESLTSIPVEIFDNNRKIRNFNYVFGWCYELRGESPYTKINGRKVHLYERVNYPDHFYAPIEVYAPFAGDSQLSDFDAMPESWRW